MFTDPPTEINFKTTLRGFDLKFSSTWGLFSPKMIDSGTKLLIDYMEIGESDQCLDLGCGYGAIGIVMAKIAKEADVYMVDKDFVAVEYAKCNVQQNHLKNCHVYLSNGFSHLSEIKFDVIASNLPANVGKEMFYVFLSDAKRFLKNNGKLYVVTISGLREFIKHNFRKAFGNYHKVKQHKKHTVAMATLNIE